MVRTLWQRIRVSWLRQISLMKRREIRKLGFDIVHGCQLRCIGCPNSTLAPKVQTISADDFGACLQNVDVRRVRALRLYNFGEPLLHPDLPGILLRIPKQSWKADLVELSTNAQHSDLSMLAEALKTGVLGRLVVSCDGNGSAADYERLRPPGKWPRLMDFLAGAKALRDKHAPQIRLMTRTICETDEGRQAWSELLARLGWTPEFRRWQVLPDAAKNPAGRQVQPANRICRYMRRNSLYVDYDGTVIPCCAHPRAFELGNLRTEKYSDILKGGKRRRMLHEMLSNRMNMPICARCEF